MKKEYCVRQQKKFEIYFIKNCLPGLRKQILVFLVCIMVFFTYK